MKRFALSVHHITGQVIDAGVRDQIPTTSVEEELEALRAKVAELSDEVGSSFPRISMS